MKNYTFTFLLLCLTSLSIAQKTQCSFGSALGFAKIISKEEIVVTGNSCALARILRVRLLTSLRVSVNNFQN